MSGAEAVDCPGCGGRLGLPGGVPEGGELACPRCALLLVRGDALRRFRWASVDPYVRAHGASRLNLWGGLAGAVLWIPLLAAGLLASGAGAGALAGAAVLALPYVAVLLLLVRRRARTPAARWMAWLWTGLGGWALLAGAALTAAPALLGATGMGAAARQLAGFGAAAVLAGVVTDRLYVRRSRRVPKAALLGEADG